MADQNITELPVKTSSGMTSSDYMLGIDSAEGYQMLIKDLGDYIIRNVQVNTIAGANQTLKSALDTLNSNFTYTTMQSGTNLNSLTTKGNYVVGNIAQMTNAPTDAGSSGLFYVVKSSTQNYIEQRFYGNLAETYRMSYDNGSTWNTWNTSALSSKTTYTYNALSMTGTVLQFLNELPNGARSYAHTYERTSDMPSGLPDTLYSFRFVSDASNRGYDYVVLTRLPTSEQWIGKVSSADLSTRTLSWTKLPSRAEVDALNSKPVTINPHDSESFSLDYNRRYLLAFGHNSAGTIRGVYVIYNLDPITVIAATEVSVQHTNGGITITNNSGSTVNGIICS